MPRKKTVSKKATKKQVSKKKTVKKNTKKVVKKSIVKKQTPKKKVVKKIKKKSKPSYNNLRGMKDITPKEGKHWMKMFDVTSSIATSYGFNFSETPILEQASLFIRSIGKGTDVVDKEMYIFEDRDGMKVCLRPEVTASFARSYINNGMVNRPQPVKAWYWGPMFRHDRPQAGRYRQFHQFGCETVGAKSPVIDAELISVAYNAIRDLGINPIVHINSIGSVEDRENYIVELVGYLRSKRSYLSDESKKRINKNPLRILDSKDEQDKIVLEDAPQLIDWLSNDSKKFFTTVLEYLDEAEIPYVLEPTLVRGLDYYTDTVFEIYEEEVQEGYNFALGGGGRYDHLVEQLGGQPTPASGFALGLERILMVYKRKLEEARKEKEMTKEKVKPYGLFFAQLGDQASKRALYLVEMLRREGLKVHHNLSKGSLKTQLEMANRLNVSDTLILGQKEVQDGTVLVRNMDSGIQEVVDQKKLVKVVKKLLG